METNVREELIPIFHVADAKKSCLATNAPGHPPAEDWVITDLAERLLLATKR